MRAATTAANRLPASFGAGTLWQLRVPVRRCGDQRAMRSEYLPAPSGAVADGRQLRMPQRASSAFRLVSRPRALPSRPGSAAERGLRPAAHWQCVSSGLESGCAARQLRMWRRFRLCRRVVLPDGPSVKIRNVLPDRIDTAGGRHLQDQRTN
jgi:hypothetical protein